MKLFRILTAACAFFLFGGQAWCAQLLTSEKKSQPALVLTAFGTSTKAEITYRIFEKKVREAFPATEVRWAFTSEVIREKLNRKRASEGSPDRLKSLEQTLSDLKAEGFKRVAVQPLHIFPGEEYEEALEAAKHFAGIEVEMGEALLQRWETMFSLIRALSKDFLAPEAGVNVVVAHGTPMTNVASNIAYMGMDRHLRKAYANVFLGGVDGVITRQDALADAKKASAKKVRFIPFMFVAGDHIMNDVMGESAEGDSWKAEMEKAGFTVEVPCVEIDGKTYYKGLGMMPEAQDVFIASIRRTLERF